MWQVVWGARQFTWPHETEECEAEGSPEHGFSVSYRTVRPTCMESVENI